VFDVQPLHAGQERVAYPPRVQKRMSRPTPIESPIECQRKLEGDLPCQHHVDSVGNGRAGLRWPASRQPRTSVQRAERQQIDLGAAKEGQHLRHALYSNPEAIGAIAEWIASRARAGAS
jgi:hypothetical protein